MNRIIYPTADGIAVIIPTGELPLEDVAAKDVPAGTPYLFISATDLPTDRTFRAAWEADFATPDGYGIGDEAWFAQRQAAQLQANELTEPTNTPSAANEQ